MEAHKLSVKRRVAEGSSSSRRLRNSGILPGTLYGSKNEAIAVEMELNAVKSVLHSHSSETILIEIDLEGEGSLSVLMKEIQHHPVTSALLHVDFQRVIAGKPIQVDIALELKGEPEGVKVGGLLDHVLHSISIQCLPKDLIEVVELDISELNIGDSVYVSDLKLSPKLTILTDNESMIAAVNAPRVEEEVSDESEEVSDESEEPTEPEVINEKQEEE